MTARVRALLRRSKQFSTEKRLTYRFDDFVLDYEAYVLKNKNKLVVLSTREFEVLRFMIKNAGNVYSPNDIYKAVWDQEFGDITAVAVYIQRIRKKIELDYHNPIYIKTIHGKGYRFEREALS